jgi:hypothetical protein
MKAIQREARGSGLLRYARNDEVKRVIPAPKLTGRGLRDSLRPSHGKFSWPICE